MRGFPKHLNTKQDYLNCLTEFPQETKAELQRLLDNRFAWVDTVVLDDEEAGITDSTHQVVDTDNNRVQRELVEDSHCELFRLGFTVAEIQELL